MQVKDVMQTDILMVKPSDLALDIGNHMELKRIAAALVLEGDEFRGILSKETFIANLEKVCERPMESLLVSDLMEPDVDCIGAEDDLQRAVALLLTQKGIVDRLPVLDRGKVVGLVSKGDMTKVFAAELKGRFKVADLMHYNPSTVFDYTPLGEVIEEMKRTCAKRILVLSGESLKGIISTQDITIALFRKKKTCKEVDPTSSLKAEDIMTHNPVTISRKADAAAAAKLMVERRFGGIPVVNHCLDGMINRTDLLKVLQV